MSQLGGKKGPPKRVPELGPELAFNYLFYTVLHLTIFLIKIIFVTLKKGKKDE